MNYVSYFIFTISLCYLPLNCCWQCPFKISLQEEKDLCPFYYIYLFICVFFVFFWLCSLWEDSRFWFVVKTIVIKIEGDRISRIFKLQPEQEVPETMAKEAIYSHFVEISSSHCVSGTGGEGKSPQWDPPPPKKKI